MSEPIKVGDLVQIVRSCCAKQMRLAVNPMFVVAGFMEEKSTCTFCGKSEIFTKALTGIPESGPAGLLVSAPVKWLKRIPPLSELKSTEQKEKVRA